MDLKGIIAISGRPGLYKVVTQGKNSLIVESLGDNKRFPAYATDRISALDDISIYTYDEDTPLRDVLESMYKKQDGKEGISHKESASVLRDYLLEILPDFDQERVYPSDIKKLFQWYNLLHKAGVLALEKAKDAVEDIVEEAKEELKKDEVKEEKPKAKKAPAKKAETTSVKPKAAAADKPKAAKATAAKKAPTKTGGTSRGK